MGRVPLVLVALALPEAARAQCPAENPGFVADVARVLHAADGTWRGGRPLSEARSAHRTNTREQFEAALAGDFNFFEGDVRVEINHRDRLEMRHDEIHESGDNLTLREWLTLGRDAGKGLKLDVKETARMEQLLDTVEDVGIADGRLMFNLGDAGMARWGAEIRRRFPGSILAINPASRLGGRSNEGHGPIQGWQVDRMIALARRFGGPVTFVLHEGQVTHAAVERLQEYGPVSVWGNVSEPAARGEALRRLGVEGMIDLGPAHGIDPGDVAAHVVNRARTWWDRHF